MQVCHTSNISPRLSNPQVMLADINKVDIGAPVLRAGTGQGMQSNQQQQQQGYAQGPTTPVGTLSKRFMPHDKQSKRVSDQEHRTFLVNHDC